MNNKILTALDIMIFLYAQKAGTEKFAKNVLSYQASILSASSFSIFQASKVRRISL